MGMPQGPYARFPGIVGPGDFNGQGLSTVALVSTGFSVMRAQGQAKAQGEGPTQPSPDLAGTVFAALPSPGPLGVGILAAAVLLLYMDRRIL